MAKKKEQEEQLDLINIQPENAKKILRAARAYKEAQKTRITALAEEVKEKGNVLTLVRSAKLTPLSDGTLKFTLDGVKISVKPRDELLTVKEPKQDGEPS